MANRADEPALPEEGAPMISTGSLIGDVALLADWFIGARDELYQGNLGWFMSEDTPMDDVQAAAAMLSLIDAQLREQGFDPPTLDCMEDPTQFLEANADYLASICPFVVDPVETVH